MNQSEFRIGYSVLDNCDESLDFTFLVFLVRSCLTQRSFMMKAFLEDALKVFSRKFEKKKKEKDRLLETHL